MYYNSMILSVFTVLLASSTAGAAVAPRTPAGSAPKAVYFISGQQVPGSIFALPVDRNGKLSAGSTTPYGASASTDDPTQVAALTAQDSIRVVDNMLFAIHGASNSISMFRIDAFDPTKLTLVGQPVATAQYPISLAVSKTYQKVCVASAGNTAGLACASFSPVNGIGKLDTLRPYFTTPNTPASTQFNSIGDVYFSNDEKVLFTSVRGNGQGFNGFLSAYPVVGGAVSYKQVTSSPAGSEFLYGSVPIPGSSNILSADLGQGIGGALIINVNSQLQGTTAKDIKIPGQSMTCWATISSVTNTGFLTDPGTSSLSEVDLQTGTLVKQESGDIAMIDIRAAGNYLYALSVGNVTDPAVAPPAVAVFDVSGGRGTAKQIQNFAPQGATARAQGMAVYS